jgi:hypothetical protein
LPIVKARMFCFSSLHSWIWWSWYLCCFHLPWHWFCVAEVGVDLCWSGIVALNLDGFSFRGRWWSHPIPRGLLDSLLFENWTEQLVSGKSWDGHGLIGIKKKPGLKFILSNQSMLACWGSWNYICVNNWNCERMAETVNFVEGFIISTVSLLKLM